MFPVNTTEESESQPLKLENKHPKNHSWRIVSAAMPIVVHDRIGHDDDDVNTTDNRYAKVGIGLTLWHPG